MAQHYPRAPSRLHVTDISKTAMPLIASAIEFNLI
jgi:hypothetical protein